MQPATWSTGSTRSGAIHTTSASKTRVDCSARNISRNPSRQRRLSPFRCRRAVETAIASRSTISPTSTSCITFSQTCRYARNPKRARRPGYGVGFSFAQYKNLMSYLAIAVELRVVPETGAVLIERAVAAVDCGQIVNPDGVRNQVEG